MPNLLLSKIRTWPRGFTEDCTRVCSMVIDKDSMLSGTHVSFKAFASSEFYCLTFDKDFNEGFVGIIS